MHEIQQARETNTYLLDEKEKERCNLLWEHSNRERGWMKELCKCII